MDNVQNIKVDKQNIEKPISIVVKEGAQYPWNKQIPFTIIVKSNIIAGPVYIDTSVNAGKFIPTQKIINHIGKGSYKIKFKYIPLEQGDIKYTFTVSATTSSTNYADSFSGHLIINKDLVRIPISSGFWTYKLAIAIGGLLIITFLLLNLKKGLYFIKDSLIPKLISKQVAKGL